MHDNFSKSCFGSEFSVLLVCNIAVMASEQETACIRISGSVGCRAQKFKCGKLPSKIYQHNLADHSAPAFVIIGVEMDPPRDPSPRFLGPKIHDYLSFAAETARARATRSLLLQMPG